MKLTWIEISKNALLNNISQIKKRFSDGIKFMAVAKANAYGHGLLEVVNIIQKNIDYLAVFAFEDAIFLRKNGIKKPILVLSRVFPDQIDLAIEHDIEVTISTIDILQKVKKNLKVHICVDTGLGRDGFTIFEMEKVISLLADSPMKINGLYAHFASADDVNFDNYTKKQIAELLSWKKEFLHLGLNPLIHHCASAAIMNSNILEQFDIARIGISLYGLWPSDQIKKMQQDKIKLIPVLSWKVRISELKFLPKGSVISYNCTYVLSRDSKLAILPIGYFDGIPRIASSNAFAIVKGKKVLQIGRVTMNLIVLDVTDIDNVKVGDVVTIIGCEDGAEVSADDWAKFAQSSNYEMVTRINSSIERIVV